MKSLLVAINLVLGTLASQAQGSINYGMRPPEGRDTFVYGVDPADPTSEILNGGREKLSGSGFFAELLMGPPGSTEDSLSPVAGTVVPFRTGGGAGLIDGITVLRIQGTFGGDRVVLQLRAWDNRGGTVNSWDEALRHDDVARGESALINNYELTGVDAAGGIHVGSGPLSYIGLYAFGLHIVPEPSSGALLALGLGSLLACGHALTAQGSRPGRDC